MLMYAGLLEAHKQPNGEFEWTEWAWPGYRRVPVTIVDGTNASPFAFAVPPGAEVVLNAVGIFESEQGRDVHLFLFRTLERRGHVGYLLRGDAGITFPPGAIAEEL